MWRSCCLAVKTKSWSFKTFMLSLIVRTYVYIVFLITLDDRTGGVMALHSVEICSCKRRTTISEQSTLADTCFSVEFYDRYKGTVLQTHLFLDQINKCGFMFNINTINILNLSCFHKLALLCIKLQRFLIMGSRYIKYCTGS